MLAGSLIVLDFETTGSSPARGDRITEVAAVRLEQGEIRESWSSLVNCGVRIPAFIQQLTGISQAMVDRAPSVQQVLPELLAFMGSAPILAHNASFDRQFLWAETDLLGLARPESEFWCSLKLSRRLLPGLSSYSLGNLAQQLGIGFKGQAHRALADAEVTAALFQHLLRLLRDHYRQSTISPALIHQLQQRSSAEVRVLLQKAVADPENYSKP